MAKESGVWGLQGVRDQQLQDQWSYDGAPGIRLVGYNPAGQLGQNNTTNYSSPVQVGQDTTSAWTEIMRIDAGAEAANNNTAYMPASELYDNSQGKGTIIYQAA